jgi:hypothetical protein
MAVMEPTQMAVEDTVEFAVLAPVEPPPRPNRAAVEPFRSTASALVELFETAEAGEPWWHRSRAAELRRDAYAHPVAAVAHAYLRVAARHMATAQLLEHQGDYWAATA